MNDDEQAVVDESNATGTVATEDNAQDELDALLGEYSTETEQTTTVDGSGDASKIDEVHAMLQKDQEEKAQRVTTDRIAESVDLFNKSLEVPLSKDMVETLLHGRAAKDPRVLDAFSKAGKDPAAWNKVVTAMARSYASEMAKSPDADATADQDAIVAAVQSATTKAPDTPDISDDAVATMSSQDFNALQRSMGVEP